MGHLIQKEGALEDDLEAVFGTDHHCGSKPSEFLRVVYDGKYEIEEKPKKTRGSKKASKPPRHPRFPSLDAADQRFIEEMILKRVKSVRLKELNRLDASPTSSSSKNCLFHLLAIIILGLLSLIGITRPSFKLKVRLRQVF